MAPGRVAQPTAHNGVVPGSRIVFVCLGNICRSPMAEVVFRFLLEDAGLADRVAVSSAGTGE